jgi:hypothetical protein
MSKQDPQTKLQTIHLSARRRMLIERLRASTVEAVRSRYLSQFYGLSSVETRGLLDRHGYDPLQLEAAACELQFTRRAQNSS